MGGSTVVVITCPECGKKYPAISGEMNICPHCGYAYYLEKRIEISNRRYEHLKEEYEIRHEIRNHIRRNPNATLKEIKKSLSPLLKRKGFSTDMIEEEYRNIKS